MIDEGVLHAGGDLGGHDPHLLTPGAPADSRGVVRLCQGIAAAHGLEVETDYTTQYPVTVNAESEADFAAGVVEDIFGPSSYRPLDSRWVRYVLGAHTISEIAGRLAAQGVGGLQRLPKPVIASLVLDWARRCVAARPDLDPVDALLAGLVHSPPQAGLAPPIGRDATGPTIAETLT